jgi:hypothetical protein
MAAKTGTYTLIASSTANGSSSVITFSSVPSTYTDLILVYDGSVSANYVWVRLNSDATANYSLTRLSGNGTTASSSRYARGAGAPNDRRLELGTALGNGRGSNIFYFLDYSNTNTLKTVLCRGGTTSSGNVVASVGLYNSTSAISTIEVGNDNAANFASGSTFRLYGIEAGNL